jgi:hypothetical protein
MLNVETNVQLITFVEGKILTFSSSVQFGNDD